MFYDPAAPEEELKLRVAHDFFAAADLNATRILGKIDFCVSFARASLFRHINFLWAEAKRTEPDPAASLTQLVLTIGKERTHTIELPPLFLGAFDAAALTLVPYHALAGLLERSDINFNVTPSDHTTPEFARVRSLVAPIVAAQRIAFDFARDGAKLRAFIAANFTLSNDNLARISVTKDNFKQVFLEWLDDVAPHISIDWNAEKPDILSADFFLADLLSENEITLKKTLKILLQTDFYEVKIAKHKDRDLFGKFEFKDGGAAHAAFWRHYERPPREEYWDYILERRDYLVPADVRERKGAFFTPRMWVAKAQDYLARALGGAWEDAVVWDCAAGTGNLLRGLPQKPAQIYASTLDAADVEIMREMYAGGNLLRNHIFQFDFLNDDFDKLPQGLQEILRDPARRQNLVIFINPPYAEATSATTPAGTGKNKTGVAIGNKIYAKYKGILGKASNELFAQFFIRIQQEISGCKLASFSTLKYLNSTNFVKFRETFKGGFLGGFCVPANTFDNVRGDFPIGFLIWDLSANSNLGTTALDVFERGGEFIGTKVFYDDLPQGINKWIRNFDSKNDEIALMVSTAPDFQHNQQLAILSKPQERYCFTITNSNLIPFSVYFAVRHAIKATWLNDRDQFLHPRDAWENDREFHADCLAFALFHAQNRISSKDGANHFIAFDEGEVGAREAFASDFLRRFIAGRLSPQTAAPNSNLADPATLFGEDFLQTARFIPRESLAFSPQARAVFAAARALWRHYHADDFANAEYCKDASLYDIKAHFQGFGAGGKMNAPQKAKDETYRDLLGELRAALADLAAKITPKIYEYGFLRE